MVKVRIRDRVRFRVRVTYVSQLSNAPVSEICT